MQRLPRAPCVARLPVAVALALLCAVVAAQPVKVVADGRPQDWELLRRAERPWRICALLPQARDKFWWGVAWGLGEQARQLGVELGLYVAGGYDDLAGQRRQWADCRASNADAYVVAAVTHEGLDAEIRVALATSHPVIDLINGVSAAVTSRSVGDARVLGEMTADYLLRRARGRPASVAWFPGPEDATWADEADQGFTARLRGQPARLQPGGRGPTDPRSQATLVRGYLERANVPDYLAGNAVAIEFAARLSAHRPPPHPVLLSYYATEALLADIANGTVLAAVNNQPVLQARIGLDLAVRALQGRPVPQQVSVQPQIVDRQTLSALDRSTMIAPPGARPTPRVLPPSTAAR